MRSWAMEDLLELVMSFVDRSVMMLGPILLLGGWGLVLYVAYVFFSTPFFSPQQHGDSWLTTIVFDALGLWLLGNILFNWIMGFLTDPGRTPPASSANNQQQMRVCDKCKGIKPVKAHHCHVCKRCILGFDHHCPWFNNCIGFFNYRYFCCTLFYLFAGCVFCASLAQFKLDAYAQRRRHGGEYRQVFFVFALCSSVGLAVGTLLAWHVYLVLSGQSTIDFYERRMDREDVSAARASLIRRKRKRASIFYAWLSCCFRRRGAPPLPRNDYDLGPARNWERVFGTKSVWRALLPSTKRPRGDGIYWQTCKSLLLEEDGLV